MNYAANCTKMSIVYQLFLLRGDGMKSRPQLVAEQQAFLSSAHQRVTPLYEKALPDKVNFPGLIAAYGDALVFTHIYVAQQRIDMAQQSLAIRQTAGDLDEIDSLLKMADANMTTLDDLLRPYQTAYQEMLDVIAQQASICQQQALAYDVANAAQQQLEAMRTSGGNNQQILTILQHAINHIGLMHDDSFAANVQQAQQDYADTEHRFIETCKAVQSHDSFQAAVDVACASIEKANATLESAFEQWHIIINYYLTMMELIKQITAAIQQFVATGKLAQEQLRETMASDSGCDALLAVAQEEIDYLQEELKQQLIWVIKMLEDEDTSRIHEVLSALTVSLQKIALGQATYKTAETFIEYLRNQTVAAAQEEPMLWRQQLEQIVVLISCSLPYWNKQTGVVGGTAVRAYVDETIPDMITVPSGIASLLHIIRDPQYKDLERNETLAMQLASALWNQASIQVNKTNLFLKECTQQMYEHIVNNLASVPKPPEQHSSYRH